MCRPAPLAAAAGEGSPAQARATFPSCMCAPVPCRLVIFLVSGLFSALAASSPPTSGLRPFHTLFRHCGPSGCLASTFRPSPSLAPFPLLPVFAPLSPLAAPPCGTPPAGEKRRKRPLAHTAHRRHCPNPNRTDLVLPPGRPRRGIFPGMSPCRSSHLRRSAAFFQDTFSAGPATTSPPPQARAASDIQEPKGLDHHCGKRRAPLPERWPYYSFRSRRQAIPCRQEDAGMAVRGRGRRPRKGSGRMGAKC